MRPPCGLRDPYNKLARSAPSPLWGEGWGERKHATSLWAEGSLQKYWHGRLPLLFGERVGVRGYMRLRWWFRSPYVLHFSVSRVTRERARGLAASPLATPAPGPGKRRFAGHRFHCGAAGIDKGGPAAPLVTFTGCGMPYSAEHEVNGTIRQA